MKKFIGLTLTVMVLAALMVGCKPNQNSAESWDIMFASGGAGGTWYLAAARIAEVLQREIPGLKVTVVEGAAIDNLKLLELGADADIAMTGTPNYFEAITGTGEFKDNKCENFDVLMAWSSDPEIASVLQVVVTEKSGLKSIHDLKDKRIAPGPLGGGIEVIARAVLEVAGYTYDDIRANGGAINAVDFAEGATLLKDGHVDAVFYKGGVPLSSIMDLQASIPIRVIDLEEDVVERFMEQYPGYLKCEIPEKAYSENTERALTIGIGSLLLANKKLPADLTEKMVAAIAKHADEINDGLPGVVFSGDPEQAMACLERENMNEGALRYFDGLNK